MYSATWCDCLARHIIHNLDLDLNAGTITAHDDVRIGMSTNIATLAILL